MKENVNVVTRIKLIDLSMSIKVLLLHFQITRLIIIL